MPPSAHARRRPAAPATPSIRPYATRPAASATPSARTPPGCSIPHAIVRPCPKLPPLRSPGLRRGRKGRQPRRRPRLHGAVRPHATGHPIPHDASRPIPHATGRPRPGAVPFVSVGRGAFCLLCLHRERGVGSQGDKEKSYWPAMLTKN
jgi:hypothetical protein